MSIFRKLLVPENCISRKRTYTNSETLYEKETNSIIDFGITLTKEIEYF